MQDATARGWGAAICLVLGVLACLLQPTLARAQLPGDCDMDGNVTGTEVLLLVDIAFGLAMLGACNQGDVNGDGAIDIAEIIAAVNIALGNAELSACPAADADGDGAVRINDLIAAVSRALQGCG